MPVAVPTSLLVYLGDWVRASWRAGRVAMLCAMIALGFIAIGMVGGAWLPEPPASNDARLRPSPKPSQSPALDPAPPPQPPADLNPSPGTQKPQSTPSVFHKGEEPRWPWEFFVVIAIAALGSYAYVAVQLQRREGNRYVERDSDAFIDSIAVWSHLLQLCMPTPRELKRFVNEVRFYAARSQVTAGGASPSASETSVVALASLRVLDRHLRESMRGVALSPLHSLGEDELREQISRMSGSDKGVQAADTALQACAARRWRVTETDRRAFAMWSDGVRL